MNIKQAKEQIKNAMMAYFTKDEFGNYVIPVERQRPVFLMGPPGVGKTAIMEQVAEELGVGLVSYSMTHHTRQSALGLPYIAKKDYGGQTYQVSEYTMSEIIASVYDMIERSGLQEGILFLDEINCVSETLAPAMLQFLQYKIFGRHRVPAGWIVVTAGNPPEYNNSVREFDVVTWDRLKRIDVEPDHDAWKDYAYRKGVHPAIMTYLDVKKGDFYKVETTVDGKQFVTARGWTDLSDMMHLYERNDLPVDVQLMGQYLQNKRIAGEFAIYYDLWRKYRADYQVDTILEGKASAAIRDRAKVAKFDERLALLGLMLDAITQKLRKVCRDNETLVELVACLKRIKQDMGKPGMETIQLVEDNISKLQNQLEVGRLASTLSDDKRYSIHATMDILRQMGNVLDLADKPNNPKSFLLMKAEYDKLAKNLKKQAEVAGEQLSNVFRFCQDVYGQGQELLILVTELTISYYGAQFISRYGCEEYYAHNKDLLFYERHKQIVRELDDLKI